MVIIEELPMMLSLRLASHRGSINRSFDHSVPTNLHSPEEYILAKRNISDRGSFCLRLATLHLVMPGTKRPLVVQFSQES